MSLTIASKYGAPALLAAHGNYISRYGINKKEHNMAETRIMNDLTAAMLPKSMLPADMASDTVLDPVPDTKAWTTKVRQFWWSTQKANRVGLRLDDFVYDSKSTPAVKEALLRIDDQELQLRVARFNRSVQLEIERLNAPKEERFRNLEEDVRYMKPWVEQVEREHRDALIWDNY